MAPTKVRSKFGRHKRQVSLARKHLYGDLSVHILSTRILVRYVCAIASDPSSLRKLYTAFPDTDTFGQWRLIYGRTLVTESNVRKKIVVDLTCNSSTIPMIGATATDRPVTTMLLIHLVPSYKNTLGPSWCSMSSSE